MRVATSTLAQREEAKEAQRKQRIDVECEEGEMEEAERRRRGISRANRSGGPTWEKAGREKKKTLRCRDLTTAVAKRRRRGP